MACDDCDYPSGQGEVHWEDCPFLEILKGEGLSYRTVSRSAWE